MTEVSISDSLISVEDQALLETTREQFVAIIESAKNFVVADDDGLEKSTDMVKVLKKGQSTLETRRKELKAPYLEAGRGIDNIFNKAIGMADVGIKALDSQNKNYHIQRRERLRREEEAQRKAEAEALKAQEDEIAEKAALEGRDAKAEVEASRERQQELKGPAPPVKTMVRGNFGSSSIRDDYDFEVIDGSKLPNWEIVANESAIRAKIKAGVRNIAGCRIFPVVKTTYR